MSGRAGPSVNNSVPSSHLSLVPPPQSLAQDCPILIWMLSLNREYTAEEYEACYTFLKDYTDHVDLGPHNAEDADSFRHLITQLLPVLMMRHRRIPRSKWRDQVTQNGKHWIEQLPDDMPPEKFLYSMIGYHIECGPSLCGIAMTQGPQKRVVNIGLGIKQLTVEPRGISVAVYLESLAHKLTPTEMSLIPLDEGDETALRRLTIILTLKEAYIHAIGQPIGFDYSRLEFNVPEGKAWGDGHPLQGWEFRLWSAALGVARGDRLVEEQYQCVCAFFRGTKESTFLWKDERKALDTWVQFINIDQMVKVLPKLMA
ncbi:hypothetical protein IW261DRAFT_1414547 [Armillaria novae-zelandiae]|uniref:holo-[acyl-carrier-protein] synthase n=1 Tax=Armillaria novae-zelandiae TaxID=153914 RepID=A0AA39PRG2_9AGAR|nr:hypothetical protein IW261DRAFT_1414547 [Armillaria novae-zelandiae]